MSLLARDASSFFSLELKCWSRGQKSTAECLSGLAEVDSLFVSDVLQKAVLEVHEEGSEAAVASVVAMSNRMMPRPSRFVCRKPFFFLITDKLTNLALFAGKVADPRKV